MSKNNSSKSLASVNQHLNNGKTSNKMRARSIASSTAIETGETIKQIEEKVILEQPAHYHVKLT